MKLFKILFNSNFLLLATFCAIILYMYYKYKKSKMTPENFIKQFIDDLPEKKIEPEVIKKRKFVHEEKCREVFEKTFGAKFPNVRPEWLINPISKRRLELDGFNPDIPTPIGKGLAFERDGEQHAIKNHVFNSGKQGFEYQQFRDNLKELYCRQKGIVLIRIPHTIGLPDIENFIKKKLDLYKIKYKI